jgi:hypothetical protein
MPQTFVSSSQPQVDGLLFEVVAEGPVAQHLEEGVVVGVEPTSSRSLCLPPARMHFWVSAARVSSGAAPAHFGDIGFALAEEDGHELVHARRW